MEMNIEDIARYYMATSAYEIPFDQVINFQKFIIDLAQIELQGINCQYVDFQPYLRGEEVCLEDIQADVNQGNLLISTQFNESDFLDQEINMIFRCIHDMHHVKLNADFSWQGELASTRHFMSLTNNFLFKQLLFSEILGQSAVYLYSGQFPSHQKVVLFEQDVLRCFAQCN